MTRISLVVLISAVILLSFVMEQVRRRRLLEEYSWLWLLTAVVYLVMAAWPYLAASVARFLGCADGAVALSFLGIYFLVFISIQYSIRLSRLTTQNKNLAQQVAILDSELKRLSEATGGDGAAGQRQDEMWRLIDQSEAMVRQIAFLNDELQKLTQTYVRAEMTAQPMEEQASAERTHR